MPLFFILPCSSLYNIFSINLLKLTHTSSKWASCGYFPPECLCGENCPTLTRQSWCNWWNLSSQLENIFFFWFLDLLFVWLVNNIRSCLVCLCCKNQHREMVYIITFKNWRQQYQGSSAEKHDCSRYLQQIILILRKSLCLELSEDAEGL